MTMSVSNFDYAKLLIILFNSGWLILYPTIWWCNLGTEMHQHTMRMGLSCTICDLPFLTPIVCLQ